MKTLFFIFSLALLTGCLKSTSGSGVCTDATPASEEATILAYTAANGITAIKDSTGLYYQVISPGTSPMPDLTDSVYVTYTGKLLNGTIFDQSTTPIGTLVGIFIEGWKIGLQKIGKGGQIKLVVPSALAYGCRGNGPIPSNSILYFDITLTNVVPLP